MCSVRVGPPAPNASVGGGACTRTPNVQTPETTWPSAESTCQRTVYAPRGSITGTGATTFGPVDAAFSAYVFPSES